MLDQCDDPTGSSFGWSSLYWWRAPSSLLFELPMMARPIWKPRLVELRCRHPRIDRWTSPAATSMPEHRRNRSSAAPTAGRWWSPPESRGAAGRMPRQPRRQRQRPPIRGLSRRRRPDQPSASCVRTERRPRPTNRQRPDRSEQRRGIRARRELSPRRRNRVRQRGGS